MAIFGRKKEAAAVAPKKEGKASAAKSVKMPSGSSAVLLAPRITEKAAIMTDSGVYVFNVALTATKPMVASAIEAMFKVTPRKITVIRRGGTRVTTRVTGKKGMTIGYKKAYVHLKKGDKIELA